jgi:hypothetical protein
MPLRLRSGLALLFCLSLTSCSKLQRVRECRALVARVNPALGGIQELLATNRRDAAFYGDVAARYDGIATELAKLSFTSEQLKLHVEEYRSVVTAAAEAVRAVGKAQTSPQSLPQARQELDRVVRREKVAVMRLDAECHAP